MCSERPADSEFLRCANVPFTAWPWPRLGMLFPVRLPAAVRAAFRLLAQYKPQLLFTTGGYVSMPLCLAAWWKGIPIVLFEADIATNRSGRLLRMIAKKVCRAFPVNGYQVSSIKYEDGMDAKCQIPNTKYFLTGYPVRSSMSHGSREEALRITGLSGERPVLLVLGGSQGSVALNRAVEANLEELLGTVDIVHITGLGKKTGVQRAGYYQQEFAGPELAHFYALANVALTRAGAGGVFELLANHIPAIIVPLEGVGGDHQTKNAEQFQQMGAGVVVPQEKLQRELPSAIQTFIACRMSNVECRITDPNPARQIADLLGVSLATS